LSPAWSGIVAPVVSLRPQAGVRVHVVPAVGQDPGAAAHALRGEAGLLCYAARRRVAHGVLEVEPVKPANSKAQDAIASTA
jgi:hypothetical protein